MPLPQKKGRPKNKTPRRGDLMTDRQAEVLDMRQARMSYRQIGKALGISHVAAWDTHQAALAHLEKDFTAKEIGTVPWRELRRREEAEYIDAQLRRYNNLYETSLKANKLRSAIEALNGAHRYLETLIRLQGLQAPEKHDVNVSVGHLSSELLKIESEVGEITETDVVEYKQLAA